MKKLIIAFFILVSFGSKGQDYLSISQKESFQSASLKLQNLGYELKHTIGDNEYKLYWRRNNRLGITEIPILINFDKLPGDLSNSGNELDVFIIVDEGTNKDVIFDMNSAAMKLKFGNPTYFKENEKINFLGDISMEKIENNPYNFKVSLPNQKFSAFAHYSSGQVVDLIISEKLISESSNYQKAFKYLKENNYADAVKFFTASIDILDNVMVSYMFRGWAKALLEDKYGSMNDLNKAFQLMKEVNKTESADLYYYKGVVHLWRKEKDIGCNCLSKAGELGYKDAYKAMKELCN